MFANKPPINILQFDVSPNIYEPNSESGVMFTNFGIEPGHHLVLTMRNMMDKGWKHGGSPMRCNGIWVTKPTS